MVRGGDSSEANARDAAVTAKLTATKFNAETHVKLFKKTFENLDIGDMSDFVIGQVADSTNLNPKIAELLDCYHIACRNHCLNLGCKDMETLCPDLKEIADKCQECHRKIKASNKLTATFENIQASARALDEDDEEPQGGPRGGGKKLKLRAATRWNSLTTMLEGHVEHSDTIHQVMIKHKDRDLDDTTVSRAFLGDVSKHLPYLKEIKNASIRMQERHATLDYCQFECDNIAEFQSAGHQKPGDPFELCE